MGKENINLFIDTNTFLDFYSYNDQDLKELKKLSTLYKTKKINILITQQVKDEYYRNREGNINTYVKKLREYSKTKIHFPNVAKEYSLWKQIKKKETEINDKLNLLAKKIVDDSKNNALGADKVIFELFEIAKILPLSKKIIQKANDRIIRGNPPGKKGSFGDAINWEILLKNVAKEEKLILLSGDGDFESSLHKNELNEFLQNEWLDEHEHKITFFKNFQEFSKAKTPEIELEYEDMKEEKIISLSNSGSFDSSRRILSDLHEINDFSIQQLNTILIASCKNNQIYWADEYSPDQISSIINNLIKDKKVDKEILLDYHKRFKRN